MDYLMLPIHVFQVQFYDIDLKTDTYCEYNVALIFKDLCSFGKQQITSRLWPYAASGGAMAPEVVSIHTGLHSREWNREFWSLWNHWKCHLITI